MQQGQGKWECLTGWSPKQEWVRLTALAVELWAMSAMGWRKRNQLVKLPACFVAVQRMLGQRCFEGKIEICETHTGWFNFINKLLMEPSSGVKDETARL